MPNNGRDFESLVSKIFRILGQSHKYHEVTKNVFYQTNNGRREFDIVAKAKLFGAEVATAIECKDHKRPLDISFVDGFESKLRDTPICNGVIVSRSGFTKNAIKKARNLGIQLYRLDETANFSDQVLDQIPVYVRVLDFENMVYSARLAEQGKSNCIIDPRHMIGIDIVQAAGTAMVNLGAHRFLDSDEMVINVDNNEPLKLGTEEGNQISIEDVSIRFKMKLLTLVGKLGDFPGAKSFVSIDRGQLMLVIPLERTEELIEKLPNLYTKTNIRPGTRRPAIFILIVPASPEFFQTKQSIKFALIKGKPLEPLSLSDDVYYEQILKFIKSGTE